MVPRGASRRRIARAAGAALAAARALAIIASRSRLGMPKLRLALVLLPVLLVGMAGSTPKKRPNMPRGWTWPPNAVMKAEGARCLEALETAGIAFEEASPALKINTPIVLPALAVGELSLVPLRGKGPHRMDCQLALALHEVAPALRELGVKALRFRALHDYRNVRKNGRTTKILSRHAIGLAMDVWEFEFDDGTIAVVERDFASDPRLAAVVAAFDAHEAFRTPLSPVNDPSGHGDHVHIEAHLRLDESEGG
jgi:hypothetical protein